jgi:hypothetical protein
MKKVTITLFTLFTFFFTTSLMANDEITLALECLPEEKGCLEISDNGKNYYISKLNQFAITKDNTDYANLTEKDGSLIIQLGLKGKEVRSLEEITKKSILKKLFVLIDHKLVSAPIIREKITDGQFIISLPKKESTIIEKLNWLNSIKSITSEKSLQMKNQDKNRYLSIAGLMSFASILYITFPLGKNKMS